MAPRRPRIFTLGVAAMLFVAPRVVHAQPDRGAAEQKKGTTATLGWSRLSGAEACIGTQELAQSVEKLLGRAVFVPASSADVAIEGRVEKKKGAGFAAVLTISNAKGETLGTREVATEGACSGLNEPVALAIALLIDPDAALGAPRDPPKPPDPPPRPLDPPPPRTVYVRVPVRVPVEAPPKPTWRGDLSAGFALGFGWLPAIAPGAFVDASLTPPHFVPLATEVTFFAPHDEEAAHGAFVRFYSLQAAGFICPLDFSGSLGSVRACAGGTAGFIVADGQGFDYEDPNESGIYAMVGGTLRGRGMLRVYRPLHVGIALEMTVPILRPEFVYIERDASTVELFQPAPVLGTIQAFASLSFP